MLLATKLPLRSGSFPLYPQGLYPWVWVPKPWNMALNKGTWDPKPKVTNIKGTNLKPLIRYRGFQRLGVPFRGPL